MRPTKFPRVLVATLGLCVFTCAALAAMLFWEPGPTAAQTPKEAAPEAPSTAPAFPGRQGVQLPAQAPGINPETFRMIESIEKKNRESPSRPGENRGSAGPQRGTTGNSKRANTGQHQCAGEGVFEHEA
jgi:hypothetical protein